MNNFICLKWGTKFDSEYVNRLYRMVNRNMHESYRFVCLTENKNGIDKNIDALPLLCDSNKIQGWWHKLSIFQEKVHDLSGPTIFLDLDVVIISDLKDFFTYPGKFCIIEDWLLSRPHKRNYNSSVFRFNIGEQNHIWNDFISNPDYVLKNYRGDQDWISEKAEGIIKWPDEWCQSFKWQEGWKGPRDNTKIMVFHGKPTPIDAISNKTRAGGKEYPASPWIRNFCR